LDHDEMMKTVDAESNVFSDGDELMFHLSSLGAQVVPLPVEEMQARGAAASMELNMMSGIYRGEDDQYWVLDVISVDPAVRDCRLLKAGVDFIGVKSSIDAVKRRIQPA
jgi:hypothetical protein